MGDTLSRPVTDKHTSTYDTPHFSIGCCGMQGWRKNMEDSHAVRVGIGGDPSRVLLAVFDGHNGAAIARHCATAIPNALEGSTAFRGGHFGAALTEAFISVDRAIVSAPDLQYEGGTTAVVILLADNIVYCANAGDSRAIMWNGKRVVPLSVDHKPNLPSERKRVERAGARVAQGRVNGTLAVSRAIGDAEFKEVPTLPLEEQAVTARPDVESFTLDSQEAILILACDGVWDVVSNERCMDIVRQSLRSTSGDVGAACEAVLEHCLSPAAPGLGCDNMTIIVLVTKPRS